MFISTVNSKKGSYIMEAAIVLPVIILTVITVILVLMFFYSQALSQSRMHLEMRAEAGRVTGKTIYRYDSYGREQNVGELYSEESLTGSKVYGKKYVMMQHRGILEKKGVFIIQGTCHGTDGAKYVRYHDFAKGQK